MTETKRIFSVAVAATVHLLAVSLAQAHFIWIAPFEMREGVQTVQVYFSEDASPDDPDLLNRLRDLKVWQLTQGEKPHALELRRREDSLEAQLAGKTSMESLFIATHDLGVLKRGDSEFRLKYYAKTGPVGGHAAWTDIDCSSHLHLDVVPVVEDGQIHVHVRWDGRPLAGAEVKASGPGVDKFEATTNAKGSASFHFGQPGLYSIRARHIEEAAGELDGKAYSTTRHYSTVGFNTGARQVAMATFRLPNLPQPVTSFGGAILGDSLCIYGGHTGSAHSYSTAEQCNTLMRLQLVESGQWETLAHGPKLQGLALVAQGGKLYRLGGFMAKNAEGNEHDLWSQDSVALFDPAKNKWSELPSLPEPRSSFDAAVLGKAIYVVGGWSMQGDSEKHWHTTAWKMDLGQKRLQWQPLSSPPFQRRALALAAYKDKLFAIGGMRQNGGPTRRVDIFNPATGEWSEGPELIGEDDITGFGTSAFATGGRLYVSTIKGKLQRLKSDGMAWELVGEMPTARFFHRMLPFDDRHLLVVGGANMEIGKFEKVEILSVNP